MSIESKEGPLPNESFLQFLRRTKRFHQLILEAWSSVEFNIDQLLTRQFGLNCDYNDKKVRFLSNSSFGRKLDFLRKVGVISPEEFHIIHEFQEHRNQFFHTLGAATMFVMSEDEKDHTMDEAITAAQLTFNVVQRKF